MIYRRVVLVLNGDVRDYPFDHRILSLDDGVDLGLDSCLGRNPFDGMHFSAVSVNPRFDFWRAPDTSSLRDVNVLIDIDEVGFLFRNYRLCCILFVSDGNDVPDDVAPHIDLPER